MKELIDKLTQELANETETLKDLQKQVDTCYQNIDRIKLAIHALKGEVKAPDIYADEHLDIKTGSMNFREHLLDILNKMNRPMSLSHIQQVMQAEGRRLSINNLSAQITKAIRQDGLIRFDRMVYHKRKTFVGLTSWFMNVLNKQLFPEYEEKLN